MPSAPSPYAGHRTAVVADADELYASALARLLQRDCGFSDVFEVASTREAIERVEADGHVGLLVLGIDAPEGQVDLSFIEHIRRRFSDLVLVAISHSSARTDILAALTAGVHGYVLRGMSMSQLSAALAEVAAGRIFLPRAVADLTSDKRPAPTRQGSGKEQLATRLTGRQLDVLRLLAKGKSNQEIGKALGLTEGTVKIHVNAIFRALQVKSRAEAAAFAGD